MKDKDKLNDELNKINFLKDEEIKNANFYELALYMQELNKVKEITKEAYSYINEKVGDNND